MFSASFLIKSEKLETTQFRCSVTSDSLRPHELQHPRPPYPSPTHSLPKPMSVESVMPSNHLIFFHPLLVLTSIFPSIGVFSNELALWFRWQKYWNFSFSINPSNKYSGLISSSPTHQQKSGMSLCLTYVPNIILFIIIPLDSFCNWHFIISIL